MAAHLGINGFWLRPQQMEVYRFMMDLYASGRFRKAVLEDWLRLNAIALK